ncbi:MAG TPA: AI-2E family transporter [Gammaproteobacteria bacterium]|nr:AI-2E family transporter [Gammaproteobacteria bacterium]
MSARPINRQDLATWGIATAALLLILYLKLLPALIAGLLVYVLVNQLTPLLRRNRWLWGEWPRLVAVSIIAAIVIAVIGLIGMYAASLLRGSQDSIPALITRMAEIIEQSRTQLPDWVSNYIPANADELQQSIVGWLRAHAAVFQTAGTGLGRALAHIVIGMVIGGLLSLETAVPAQSRGPLASALAKRSYRLSVAFRRVVFAQLWISALNTTFTALYLAVALPLFGVDLPFTKTLIVVTFVAGLLPILGNLISNTVIFIVSFSQSPLVALVSLAYLIVIHKLEYFLNARIIGSHIRARAWEMLLAMLLMEAAFGIPGLIAAPIYYAYMKSELREKGLI